MIVLDTNVISEMMKASPSSQVLEWLDGQPATNLYITTITEAELRYGAELLPTGQRRKSLAASIERMLAQQFSDRILPFDSQSAIAYAVIASHRRQRGKPISHFDAQIAAVAKCHHAALATRDVSDFIDCGISVINPWESPE